MVFFSKHISVSVPASADKVYAFVSDPMNLPKWAAGLSGSIQKKGDDWVAESSMGQIKIKFADKNTFGVLDHDVTLPSGETFYNPMRVFQNGEGCEVVFTLYLHPGQSDQQFLEDEIAVAKDLRTLKTLLEKKEE